jgi:capsular polysaccharide biosynthesis protein
MSTESIPDETELKVFNLLARASKPKPVQDIANEIQQSYEETMKYLKHIGERRHIRFHHLDDGFQAVSFVTVSQRTG